MAITKQLQRPGALLDCSVWERSAAVAVRGSAAGALQWPGSSSCRIRERCRSVAVARKQQLQRLGVQQELRSGQEAPVAASVSAAGLLRRPGVLQEHCNGQEALVTASGSAAGQLQRLGVLQERCSGQEAAVAASGSIAGALQ